MVEEVAHVDVERVLVCHLRLGPVAGDQRVWASDLDLLDAVHVPHRRKDVADVRLAAVAVVSDRRRPAAQRDALRYLGRRERQIDFVQHVARQGSHKQGRSLVVDGE